jgi:hypothetical protein
MTKNSAIPQFVLLKDEEMTGVFVYEIKSSGFSLKGPVQLPQSLINQLITELFLPCQDHHLNHQTQFQMHQQKMRPKSRKVQKT